MQVSKAVVEIEKTNDAGKVELVDRGCGRSYKIRLYMVPVVPLCYRGKIKSTCTK